MPEAEIVAWVNREFSSSRDQNRVYDFQTLGVLPSGEKFSRVIVTSGVLQDGSLKKYLNFCFSEIDTPLCEYGLLLQLNRESKITHITESVCKISAEGKITIPSTNTFHSTQMRTASGDFEGAVQRLDSIIDKCRQVRGKLLQQLVTELDDPYPSDGYSRY